MTFRYEGLICSILQYIADDTFDFNLLPPDHVAIIMKVQLSSACYRWNIWAFPVKLLSKSMPQNPANISSTLVKIMVWYRQATSHCRSQCWPRSMSPYGATRPQCIKSLPDIPDYTRSLVQLVYLTCVGNAKTFCIIVPEVSTPEWPWDMKVSYVPHCYVYR